jgi:hypothetical protein
LEQVDKDRAVLEEIVLPEKEGVLSSKRYVTTANGAVLRETGVGFCDHCGSRLDENKGTIVCSSCRRKICGCDSPQCAIGYRGRYYCEECLQQLLSLDRLQFKIIHGLVNNLRLSEIRDLTHSKKEEFDSALNQLTANGYLDRKGISLFARYEILDRGILAWKTYYRSFSTDGEIAYFIEQELHQREK